MKGLKAFIAIIVLVVSHILLEKYTFVIFPELEKHYDLVISILSCVRGGMAGLMVYYIDKSEKNSQNKNAKWYGKEEND